MRASSYENLLPEIVVVSEAKGERNLLALIGKHCLKKGV